MVMNMKGGVGKTTLAVELSRSLAYYYDKDVLLIDYDPQANASLAFLGPGIYFGLLGEGKSVADCLMPSRIAHDPFSIISAVASSDIDLSEYSINIRSWYYEDDPDKKAGKLDIVPGNLELMRLALNVLKDDTDRIVLSRWNSLINAAKKEYDCIVIDCHPAGSFFTKSALLASNVAIIPVTSDAYAATGLNMMRQHMERWESSGGAKDFVVVFNDAHKSWDISVEADIREDSRFAENCLANRMKYSNLLRNLPRRHQTAAEQPVAHKRRVAANVHSVTEEMVHLLQSKGIFDSSWRQ